MSELISKFGRIVLMRIFSRSTVLLLEWKEDKNPQSPVQIQEVTTANVADALGFQSQKQVQQFSHFLQKGDRGYYGYLDNACVHRSWVVSGPAKVLVHKFYSIDLDTAEVFIQYCETAPAARGKNIFAHVLAYMAGKFTDKRVLTSVNLLNASSRRSMEKAGFIEVDRITITMILGIRFVSHEFKQG